jgi:PiT family inorganic phosphate transporter
MSAWLSSGLLLGWSIGANVGANVFATAVASGMVRFATMVKLTTVFVILGGLVNGPAAMETLGRFGAVDNLPAAFSVALASAATMIFMTAVGLPVSAAQTAVGALIGYQFFHQGRLDTAAQGLLQTIVITWICVPFLAAVLAFSLYRVLARLSRRVPMPLFILDQWQRVGLIGAGCYGAWALGGNNVANVMSFYVNVYLFAPQQIGPWVVSQTRILALFGGVAIALGMATYSRRIMLTVGRDLVKLDALTALVAILSQAVCVDLLAHSWQLGGFTLPAIPVSLSQALVGSLLGLGLARGIQTIKFHVLRNIMIGWFSAPLMAGALVYLSLPLISRMA